MLEDIPQPVLAHFGELRRRVLRVMALGAVAFFSFAAVPSLESSLAVRFFRLASSSLLPEGARLVFLDPLEPLWTALKAACALSVALTGPYALYQALAFVSPALERSSRRLLFLACAAGAGLFALGAAFAWLVMIPAGMRLFMAVGAAAGAAPMIGCDRFFGFVLATLFVFGLPFELPLVLALLMRAGVLSPGTLREYRRPAYLAILVTAALITPDPTPVSQLLLSAALVLFYELALLASPLLLFSPDESSSGRLQTCRTSD